MGELIQVKMNGDRLVTDSLNVATVFAKQHAHVLRDIRALEKDVSNFGEMFFKTDVPDSYGRSRDVYLMTRDGFTLLAMGFTGKDALAWKVKYIEAFNLMEQKLNSPELLMAKALKIADKRIQDLTSENKALEDKIKQDRPKTIFADAVTASTTSILIRDLAKMIRQNGVEIGEKRLYKWMRDNGYICKGDTSPTQRAMEMGLFEIEAITIKRANQLPIERRTTKVTGKGQVYFCNKFLNQNEVSA